MQGSHKKMTALKGPAEPSQEGREVIIHFDGELRSLVYGLSLVQTRTPRNQYASSLTGPRRPLLSVACLETHAVLGHRNVMLKALALTLTVLARATRLLCRLRKDFILANLALRQQDSALARLPQGLKPLFRRDAAPGLPPGATGWCRPERPLPGPQRRSR